MFDITTGKVTLQVADGTQMNAYVARPVGEGRRPGVIIFQEAFGVNGHIRDVTERYARHGYVAVAPELYHRAAPGYEGGYENIGPSLEMMKTLTDDGLLADARAVHAWFQQDAGTDSYHLAAVGFCMGGRVAFLANTVLPLQAAVSYYGGGIVPGMLGRAADLRGAMLFFWAGLDKHIGKEAPGAVAEALHRAGKSFVNVEFSHADHGFNCNVRASYNPAASRQAEALVMAFLADAMRA